MNSVRHQSASPLTRRSFLAAASASAAALSLPVRLAHAAPAATPQPHGGGYYTRSIGESRVTILADGAASMPTPFFSVGAPQGAPEAALRERFLATDAVPVHFNALLIGGHGSRVLVDAGRGHGMRGMLIDNLARCGGAPESIDKLVITHLHFDHIGGALDASGAAVFANCEVLMHRDERDYWASEPDLADLPIPAEYRAMVRDMALQFLKAYGPRIRTFTDGFKLAPHISLIHAPGHTPGHCMVKVSDGQDALLYIADALHVPAIQLRNPDWQIAFDTDRKLAQTTRKSVLTKAADDRSLIAGSHIPFPALGHVRREDRAFEFEPILWDW